LELENSTTSYFLDSSGVFKDKRALANLEVALAYFFSAFDFQI
jgi:hypothetical protein